MLAKKYLILSFMLLGTLDSITFTAHASPDQNYILTSTKFLRGIPKSEILSIDEQQKIAVLKSNPINESILSKNAHLGGRCGGYEKVSKPEGSPQSLIQNLINTTTKPMSACPDYKNEILRSVPIIGLVNSKNIESHVLWLSSFKTRYHKSKDANQVVSSIKTKVESLLGNKNNIVVSLITHKNTPQNSIKIHFKSAFPQNPPSILGGHLDSINGWGFGDPHAPGADDNASGIGALMEAARVLSNIELTHDILVYFYAGEEAGLLGSAEIAKQTKTLGQNVRGVLQLDMTMFPGDGVFTIASMRDFTDPRLRKWLVDFNEASKLGATILEDECGYGCSDHASWHRQGFSALMPFESTFDSMNKNIHTSRDVVDARSNFDHAATFSKIAVGFALSAPDINACR